MLRVKSSTTIWYGKMSKRVFVTDSRFPNLKQEETAARSKGADFKVGQCKTDIDVAAEAEDADVVVVQFAQFGSNAAKSVRKGATVLRYGVGYDNIDLDAAIECGLKVGYVPDYCTDEVADHTSAFILLMARKLVPLDKSIRSGNWSAVEFAKPLKSLSDTIVGFFGMGQMGRAVKKRLEGFGFQYLAADPFLEAAEANRIGIELVDVEEMVERSDIITIHAPATEDTIGSFNTNRFKKMKSSAMLVNTARGNLVVEEDLARALVDGTIAGAALDVFAEEPLPLDSPLKRAPNCLLTPHAAWYSDSAINRLQGLIAEDITRALDGQPPRKPVPGTYEN